MQEISVRKLSANPCGHWRPNRKSLCSALLLMAGISLGGCVNHDFVPGPGMLAADFEPEAARCRIFARSGRQGYAAGAAGSPRFVAGAMAGAVVAGEISNAIQQNENYNDCMISRGWRVASRAPAPLTASAIQTESLSPSSTAPTPNARRNMRVRVNVVSSQEAAARNLRTPGGLIVLEVFPGGVANSAGLMNDDIILTFDGQPVTSADDMQRRLRLVQPNTTIVADVWRNGVERPIPLQF